MNRLIYYAGVWVLTGYFAPKGLFVMIPVMIFWSLFFDKPNSADSACVSPGSAPGSNKN